MDRAVTVHRLLRSLQAKYRFMRHKAQLPLTSTELHMLLELKTIKECSISKIATILDLEQSVTSRAVASLKQKKMVRVMADKLDSRQKIISVSEKGAQLVTEIDKKAGETLNYLALGLTDSEQEQLAHFFCEIADGLHQPRTDEREGEKSFRREHRRVARGMGFLRKDIFHSGLSESSWLVLSEASERVVAPSGQDLARAVSLAKNSVASILEQLEMEGLIKKTVDPHNHRRRNYSATEKGQVLLRKIEMSSGMELEAVFSNQSLKSIDRKIELLRKFVEKHSAEHYILHESHEMTRVLESKRKQEVRCFLLRELVKHQLENFIPKSFFDDDLDVWELIDTDSGSDSICAAFLVNSQGRKWSVQAVAWTESVSKSLVSQLIRSCYKEECGSNPQKELVIEFSPFAPK